MTPTSYNRRLIWSNFVKITLINIENYININNLKWKEDQSNKKCILKVPYSGFSVIQCCFCNIILLILHEQVFGSCIATLKFILVGAWKWHGLFKMENGAIRSCHLHPLIFPSVEKINTLMFCYFLGLDLEVFAPVFCFQFCHLPSFLFFLFQFWDYFLLCPKKECFG